IDVNWLPGDVRQGSKLNVGDTLTNNPGDLKVTYTATVVAGHFSDDGSGLKPVPGDTISPSVGVDDTASCAIPLPGESPRACSKRTEIHITDFNFFDIVLAKIFLVVNTDFTVSSDGVVTVRSVTVSNGMPIADANLKWDQISPQTLADPIFFTCQQPVGAEALYDLKGIGTNISGN